jgi:hypothetical protein
MTTCAGDFEFHVDGNIANPDDFKHITKIPEQTVRRRSITPLRNATGALVKQNVFNNGGKVIRQNFVYPMQDIIIPARDSYEYDLNNIDEFKQHQHEDNFPLKDFIRGIEELIEDLTYKKNLEAKNISKLELKCPYSGCTHSITLPMICTLIDGIESDGEILAQKFQELYTNIGSNKGTVGDEEEQESLVDSGEIRLHKYVIKLIGIRDEKPENVPSIFVKGIDPFTLLCAEKDIMDCRFVKTNIIPDFLRGMRNSTYKNLDTVYYSKGILNKYGLTLSDIEKGLEGGNPVQSCFHCGRVCINHRHLSLNGAPTAAEIDAVIGLINANNLEKVFIKKYKFAGFSSFAPYYKFLTYKMYHEKDRSYLCGGRAEMIARAWSIYDSVLTTLVGGMTSEFDPTSTNPDTISRLEQAALKADRDAGNKRLLDIIFEKIYPGKAYENIEPTTKENEEQVNYNALTEEEREELLQKAVKKAQNELAGVDQECAANVAVAENRREKGVIVPIIEYFTKENPLILKKITLANGQYGLTFREFSVTADIVVSLIATLQQLGRTTKFAKGGRLTKKKIKSKLNKKSRKHNRKILKK